MFFCNVAKVFFCFATFSLFFLSVARLTVNKVVCLLIKDGKAFLFYVVQLLQYRGSGSGSAHQPRHVIMTCRG